MTSNSETRADEQDSPNPARRVVAFFALTYGISWLFWIAGAMLGTDTASWPILSTLAGFGPLLAGGVLCVRDGRLRRWASQAIRWRVDLRWWAVAFLGAPIISLLGYGLYVAVAGVSIGLAEGPLPILYLSLFGYILLLRGGFGEEMGWRGYALPLLLERFSTTAAALIVGFAWAGWHIPLFFIQGTSQAGSFGLYLVSVVGLSVVLAWLYTRSSGSVLLASVFHAQWNVFDSGALFSMVGMDSWVAPAASALVIWAVALFLVFGDRTWMRSIHDGLGPASGESPDKR